MVYVCPLCKGLLEIRKSKFAGLKLYKESDIQKNKSPKEVEILSSTNRAYFCSRCEVEYPIYTIYNFEIPKFSLNTAREEVAKHAELANEYSLLYDQEEFFKNMVIAFFSNFETETIYPDIYSHYLQLKEKVRILDIGCGTGRMLVRISNWSNTEIYGLDISPGMLAVAANKLIGSRNLNLLIGDSQSLPFQKGIFDICLMNFGVISFAPEDKKVLRDLNYVMKKDGIVWLSTYNANGLNFYASKFYDPSTVIKISKEKKNHIEVAKKEVYCKPYTSGELRDLLENNGFKVEKETSILSVMVLLPSRYLQESSNIAYEWVRIASELERLAQSIEGLNKLGAYLIVKARKVEDLDTSV